MRPIYDTTLPPGWCESQLRDVTIRKRGHSWAKEDEAQTPAADTIPVVRIPNINEKLDLTDLLHLRNVPPEVVAESAVSKGWILFVGSNGNPDRIGDSVLITEDRQMIFASFLMAITSKDPAKLLPEFLALWMKLHNVHETFSKTCQQTTGLGNFSWSAVKKLPVRYPESPLAQQAIVDLMNLASDALEAAEGKLLAARRLKTALLQQLFTHGLPGRHTQFQETKIGRIPAGWEVVRIRSLGKVVTGVTPPTEKKEYYNSADCMFVTPGDIGESRMIKSTARYISEAGVAVARPLPERAIMTVCIGATIGKVAMAATRCCTNQQINSLICDDPELSEYIFYWLRYRQADLPLFAGQTAVPIMNKRTFEQYLVALPRLREEAVEIAGILMSADDVIESIHAEIAALRRLKRSLLQNLLTGKVRVKGEVGA